MICIDIVTDGLPQNVDHDDHFYPCSILPRYQGTVCVPARSRGERLTRDPASQAPPGARAMLRDLWSASSADHSSSRCEMVLYPASVRVDTIKQYPAHVR